MAKIIHKKSSIPSKVPLVTDLEYGELALNYKDGKLYFKNATNVIQSFDSDTSSFVTLTGTQTLTNKTLTSPTITGGTLDNVIIGGTTPTTITGTDVSATGFLKSLNSVGDEGGEIQLAKAQTNTTLSGNVTIDVYQNKLRIFENGGTNRGVYIDLSAANTSVGSNLLGATASVTSVGGYTGEVTATQLLTSIKTVDGSGSGLDADLLDGQSGAYYLDWTNTTNKPTTLAGYGITDAAASTHNHNGTYQPLDGDLTAIAALAGTSGFLKKTAADTWSLDTSTYLTGNQSISVSGDATGSGTTSIALTLANSGVVAGTYTKVTVDAKGRVTTGASLASADLPTYTGTITSSQVTTALGYTPYNSTNPNGYTTNAGTVTSVGGTGTVSGLTLTGTVTTTGNLTLGGTLSVTPSNFASQTANTVLAAPNGSAGTPTFRALVAADIPTLNQNTTGSAGSVANALTIGSYLTGTSYNGSSAVTIAVDATSANTASKVVARDASGNFSAGTITATLSGNASTVTNGVYTTGSYADPAWITSLAKSKVGLGNVENTALSTWAGSTNITTIGAATATSLTVTGDLTINGTTTTINSTTLSVDDKNIELGSVTTPTNTTADGGGITLKGATDKTFNWINATGAWTSSEHIALAAGKDIFLSGATSGTVTLAAADVAGTTTITLPATTGTVVTTGDTGTVTNTMLAGSIANAKLANSSVTVNGTAISLGGSGTITATATNALTIGSYLTGTSYNGSSAVTIAVDATNLNTASKVVARDASGNFSAGTITAALSGNATTATTLATSRNINGVAFNGSADITITAANPNALTIGTGLSGTSYNGSAAVTIALATAYGDTTNPYASKTANYVLAAPNGTAGAPTFRALVAADIPTLNQNTTGNAATATTATNLANGSAGTIPYQSAAGTTAMLAAGTSGYFLKANGATAPSWVELSLTDLPDAWTKKSVRVATTAAITLSAPQTIDGIAVVAGDRVLVKDQASAATNGIYVVAAGAWTRATDANTASKLAGACVNVDSGTANGGFRFDTDLKATDTLGTTALYFYRIYDTGDSATAATANKLALRDANGDLTTRYFLGEYTSMSHTAAARTADTVFYSSTDNYIRKNTAAGFKQSLALNNVENTALSTWAGSANITTTGTVTSGTWSGSFGAVSGANLTSLNASNLGSGTVPGDRGVTSGSASSSFVEYNGTTATAGQFDGGTTTPTGTTRLNYGGYFYPTFINLVGSGDTATAASHYFVETGSDGFVRPKTLANVQSEVVTTAVLGSGTANSTTYLAGDRTWKAVSGFSTTDDTTTNTSYYPVIATTAGGSTAKTSSTKLYFNPSTGTLNATIFNSLSDSSQKHNVTKIQNAISIVTKIDGVEFDWRDNNKHSAGVIAQQLENILPWLVVTSEDGIKSVNYSGIIGYLIEAVKELSDEVNQLKNK